MANGNSSQTVTWRRRLAQAGEQAAWGFYRKRGYTFVARNWRSGRYAEIDLIVRDAQGVFIFVEVKTRRKPPAGSGFVSTGFEAVDWRKQQKIVTGARAYLSRYASANTCRFDVLVVLYDVKETLTAEMPLPEPIITHVSAAFCGL